MLKVLSTHALLRQRLHPGLLDTWAKSGAQGIELFAARQHFDYTSRVHQKEIGDWFRASPVTAFSMHAPLYADTDMGRGGAPGVNVIHPDKSRRIAAMDEIKRAIEAAEQIPFQNMIIHLGERDDTWSPRALEHSLTALEHLRAFANPLGVKLLVENLQNDVAQPRNIVEILNTGHFKDIGVCLDVGHAHLGEGVAAATSVLKERLQSTHIHDNQGDKDAHLWPGDGTIDWKEAMPGLKSAPKSPAAVLEIHYALDETAEVIASKARSTFEKLEL
jgi:sugar phosphate isomerase/epimerase